MRISILLSADFPRCVCAELDGLSAIPNVASVEARTLWWTKMRRGGRVVDVVMVGIEDFADQRVNVVSISRGAAPPTPGDQLGALLESGTPGMRPLPPGVTAERVESREALLEALADTSWKQPKRKGVSRASS